MLIKVKSKNGDVMFNKKHITHITDGGGGYRYIHFVDGKNIVVKYSDEDLDRLFINN